jgi:inorganic pyrophosphatase
VLAVPDKDPLYRDYHDVSDIPQHFLQEVAHFFSVYKDLEGARVEPGTTARNQLISKKATVPLGPQLAAEADTP